MAAAAEFLLGQLSLAVLGAGAAFHPSLRSLNFAARLAAAFGAGAVGLTIEATLFSIAGVPWSVPALAIPLLSISLAGEFVWRKRPTVARKRIRIPPGVAVCSGILCALSLLYLALSFTSSSATSVDFLYFWGVKAVRFARARGFDAEFLSGPFSHHTVPEYPPLVPIVEAWGCLAAGRMPWRAVPSVSWLWAAAALPLLFETLRRRLGDGLGAGLTAFWSAALSSSLANSYSGGNAEAPLLFFESVGLAWLLTERAPAESRFVPALCLCGASLAKVEGSLAVFLIMCGVWIRNRGEQPPRRLRRTLTLATPPAIGVGLWFVYQVSRSLPAGYRSHGRLLELFPRNLPTILEALVRNLDAGSLWLPWLFGVLGILALHRRWRAAAPALLLCAGLLVFLVFDYLHDRTDPTERIGWTAPRVSQPALSAVVLAAGLASAHRRRGRLQNEREPEALRGIAPRIECRGSERNRKEMLMRGKLSLGLVLSIGAAAASGCGKSEKPGPAPVSEVTAAPAVTQDAHPPIAMMNTPGEAATVANKSWGTGWALDDSGIFSVTATTETGAVASAKTGQPFPGVKDAYPKMPDNDKAGFIFGIPDLPPGPHTLTVEVVAKDGGKVTLTRRFSVR